MGISLKTHKLLWGRSGNRCAFPDCRRSLAEGETETDDPSVIGDEAHIIGREEASPRGESDLPIAERDQYDNLLLLCKIHHKIIDDQPSEYTVGKLKEMKSRHERWVDENLSFDKGAQKDDVIYASYVDKWIELADLDNWDGWTSPLLSGGQPHTSVERFDRLRVLNKYIYARIWPNRYPDLRSAFENFRHVLNDLLQVFSRFAEVVAGEDPWYSTKKIYHQAESDEEYEALLRKFEYHVDLVEDLVLELTRAGNHTCDMVRAALSSAFRLEEGVLLVTSGPHLDLSFKTRRVEYHDEERVYPGLGEFMKIRETRTEHFGAGVDETYFFRTGLNQEGE